MQERMLLVLFGYLLVKPLEERWPVDESKAPQRMNVIEILLDEETNSRRTRQMTGIQPFGSRQKSRHSIPTQMGHLPIETSCLRFKNTSWN